MILVVEDNLINQMTMLAVLRLRHHATELAENGDEAVRIFPVLEPDLILMDISMPVMNGYESARAIRALEEGTTKRTPIIAVTAHASQHDRQLCLQAGMDDYFAKPFEPELFLDAVSAWLNGKGELSPHFCPGSQSGMAG